MQKLGLIQFSIFAHALGIGYASAGVIYKDPYWKYSSPVITYCFGDVSQSDWVSKKTQNVTPVPENIKALTEKTLTEAYSREKTGVSFVSLARCSETRRAVTDIVFFFGQGSEMLYGVGGETRTPERDDGKKYKRSVRLRIDKSDPESHLPIEVQLKRAILHEFGHVAGLEHEFLRPEARADLNCDYLQRPNYEAGRNYALDALPIDLLGVGSYDPKSIMNYCYEAYLLHNGEDLWIDLSDGDRETLRHLYP